MVTVRDLVYALMHQCDPDDRVSIVHDHYDGCSEVYHESDPVLVVGRGELFIVSDDYYAKQEAERRLGVAYDSTFVLPIPKESS